MTNIEAKADIFNEYFVQTCSETSTSSTVPSCIPRSQNRLEQFAIKMEGAYKLVRSLVAKKLMVVIKFLLP